MNDTNEYMLTTIDNPFNPFTDWDEWYAYDREKGYNTCEYLARIARTSEELSDSDNAIELNNAIDEIIKLNPLGIYMKIKKNDKMVNKEEVIKLMNET